MDNICTTVPYHRTTVPYHRTTVPYSQPYWVLATHIHAYFEKHNIYIFIEAWNYTDIFGKYPTVGSTSVPFLASQDINNDLTSGSKSGDPGDQYRLWCVYPDVTAGHLIPW